MPQPWQFYLRMSRFSQYLSFSSIIHPSAVIHSSPSIFAHYSPPSKRLVPNPVRSADTASHPASCRLWPSQRHLPPACTKRLETLVPTPVPSPWEHSEGHRQYDHLKESNEKECAMLPTLNLKSVNDSPLNMEQFQIPSPWLVLTLTLSLHQARKNELDLHPCSCHTSSL